MENTYFIDDNLKIIFENYYDQVSMKDIIDLIKNIISDTSFDKGFNVYADFSNAMPDFSLDINSMKESIDFFRSIEDLFNNCKWAIFAPQDYVYTFSLIFTKVFNSKKIIVKVFKDEHDAKKWLE